MKYFKEKEFLCKCGCGKGTFDDMNPKLLKMLDELRGKAGIPIVLSSAFRCSKHNKKVGGVTNSSHVKGMAVDMKCYDGRTRFKILKAAFEVGFRRIEPKSTWIHVDVDPDKTQDTVFYE